jgi:two-component system chemotaxis response regulator CheB
MRKKIRVLVIDDSAAMRQLLTEILNSDPGVEVVGTAPDPFVAREKIKLLNPDVLTLDVEMPRMDGLAFLRNLMRLRPMPVVMCSSLTQKGAAVALDALALGAVDIVAKPAVDVLHGIKEAAQEIIAKVKMAADAHVRTLVDIPAAVADRHDAGVVLPKRSAPTHFATTDRIVAIGASTGGTEAIKEVLSRLPSDVPGIVIAQHIPLAFSGPFAQRMNASSLLNVCEASDGQPILAGHAYIAPGDKHLLVVRNGARYQCRLSDGELVNRHRPSVDVLFRSVAQSAGRNSIGVMLTGMGRDGAEGMKEMRDAGALTIAQDEDSSVVWGMPGAAWQLGAVQTLHPIRRIAEHLIALANTPIEKPRKTQTG